MNDLSFARPIARAPDSLAAKLATPTALSPEEDDLLTSMCGVAPGYPEAFATEEARNAALGPFGPYVTFVPASWIEAEVGGFAISTVAIGHRLGDPGFALVAPQILDAVANRIQDHDDHDIVIHRTRYIVRRQKDGKVKVCGWVQEFDAAVDISDGMETALHLESELNRRLVSNGAH